MGTDEVSSEEQVQCLSEWTLGSVGDSNGRPVAVIGGDTLTVSHNIILDLVFRPR